MILAATPEGDSLAELTRLLENAVVSPFHQTEEEKPVAVAAEFRAPFSTE